MLDDLAKEINRISNLKNYKSLSKDDITQIANNNLKLKAFKDKKLFYYDDPNNLGKQHPQSIKEEVLSEEKFKYYISKYNIDTISDLDNLSSLIFWEILGYRFQSEINKFSAEGKFPPDRLTTQLQETQEKEAELKIKLGIDKKDISDNQLTVLQQLEKRFNVWLEENRNECTLDVPMICEKCNHEAKYSYLLRKRVKDFDVLKHPWFAGRWFFNLPVLKFVKQGILTKQQAAEILSNASENINTQSAFSQEYCTDYIDYCLDHWAEITSFLK